MGKEIDFWYCLTLLAAVVYILIAGKTIYASSFDHLKHTSYIIFAVHQQKFSKLY